MARTVAVLGPIPRDQVITADGNVFEKYGCALYTTAALSALLSPRDRICPIVNVRKQDEQAIRDLLAPLPNVDLTGIRSTTDRGAVVELTYLNQNDRRERQTDFMSPILPEHVEFALDADAFVCVPITDYEVGAATLAYIKANSDGFVLLDAHGPTVALTRGGTREHRLWLDRDGWLPYVDLLKMNRDEAGRSWFPAGRDELGGPLPLDEIPVFAEHCLRRGVRAVCVTLDEDGCVAYTLGADGELRSELVGNVPVDEVIDTTGCGDSFAAGMAFGYLAQGDLVTACRYGNAMGAQRCASRELTAYKSLAETDRQIAEVYGGAHIA